jgi:hypothetical protein
LPDHPHAHRRLIHEHRRHRADRTRRQHHHRLDQPTPLPQCGRQRHRAQAREAAIALARQIAGSPQNCLLADRLSALRQWDLAEEEALANELSGGVRVIESGETRAGASRFASGAGRHGAFGGANGPAQA